MRPPTVAARHLRVTVDEVRAIRAIVAAGVEAGKSAANVLQTVVDNALIERWQADADAALAVLTNSTTEATK